MAENNGLRATLRQAHPTPLDASLSCSDGELLALVGPSGSGKTTLLRCIAGLATANTGSVACAGDSWWDHETGRNLRPHQRRVGMVFQSYGLFNHLNARRNIETAMTDRDVSIRSAEAMKLLELVNLSGLEARMPAELSGGQRQRVALARALARQPEILLLDEPFSALDQVTRKKLRKELARLRRTLNIPIVLVTHDLDEAYQLADTMCILHRGRTLQSAPPEQLLSRPDNAQIARLVGQTNLFNGKVVQHDHSNGKTWISWRDHRLETPLSLQFNLGQAVQWLIPNDRVILHQRVRPSRGEPENPVEGRIAEMIRLGSGVAIELVIPGGRERASISFSVPLHVVERNSLAVGEPLGVSLKSEGIHLMKPIDGVSLDS